MQVSRVGSIDRLKNLKLNDTMISKVLSAKTPAGKDVFDKKGIKLLEQTSKMKDTKFFSTIMQNLDGIEFIKKKFNPFKMTSRYEIQSHNGINGMYSIMTVSLLTAKTIIDTVTQKGDETTKNYRVSDKHFVSEGVKKTIGEKLLDDYDVFYDKDENSITRRIFKDGKLDTEHKTIFSEEGLIKSAYSKQYSEKNGFEFVQKENNYDKNVFAQTITTLEKEKEVVSNSAYTVQNPYTKKNETIKMELSDIAGVYNSTVTDSYGNSRIESIAKHNSDGSFIIKKNFESPDGTKTIYNYHSSKDGKNVKMYYQIKSADGEVLTTVDRTFNRVKPNLAYSSVNGHKYKIETTEDFIKVTDYANDDTRYIKKTDFGRSITLHPQIFDKLSGDMILDLYKRGYTYNFIYDDSASCIQPATKELNTGSNLYSFSHEQGHTKDISSQNITGIELINYSISSNPLLKKTYEEERLAFIQACSSIPQKEIAYFIDKLDHYMGKDGGLVETVAEINAILSTATGKDHYSSREYYLQKYFPRTIAIASKLLMPDSNIFVTKS